MIFWITGCGQTGVPLPPTLRLPVPVDDLTANRVADQVTLRWTMPHRTTDKLALKGPQPVHICRQVGNGSCETVADVSFPPEKPASYVDTLPASLAGGSKQLLSYTIEVRNRHGRSAGASNPVYTLAGAAPPPLSGVRGEMTASGVLLQWQPSSLNGDEHKIEIQRTLLSISKPSTSAKPGHSPFAESSPQLVKDQMLTVQQPDGLETGKVLDPDAAPNQRYSYRLSRAEVVTVNGKSVQVEGATSSEISVTTKDTFPPRPPIGLAAVAAPDEGAIDLSWAPNTESDLAGYAVYRRQGSSEPTRVSPADAPLETPSYRDLTAKPGQEYTYSVSAIDRDGNESARSVEVTETLRTKP
ncbi:fibronectin type III domain-containing protein [Acidisarcina polymorpha]|nr:hypothetical protein [Acidisarcina polymorpha]